MAILGRHASVTQTDRHTDTRMDIQTDRRMERQRTNNLTLHSLHQCLPDTLYVVATLGYHTPVNQLVVNPLGNTCICLRQKFSLFSRHYVFIDRKNHKKNKTNHPISSNSHPSATANTLPQMKGGGGGGHKTNGNILKKLTKYVAVHQTAVSKNYSSSGMLTNLIKAQTVFILCNIFAGKITQKLYLKGPNNVFPKLITFQYIVFSCDKSLHGWL